ncbi:hypothetical protein AGMMS50267_04030 [Spirochaetia bacterium]|nr:hypothetical protein AGMMS50267_04030 [Spirochaetia bacterium]
MIKHLKTTNIGPMTEMELDFSKRLNLFTGDNGLGKSFLLDIVWRCLTGSWAAEINQKLIIGKEAIPNRGLEGKIDFTLVENNKNIQHEIRHYKNNIQPWSNVNDYKLSDLVIYAMADDSFAVCDPYRSHLQSVPLASVGVISCEYVFSPSEVWEGLINKENTWMCNGLIRDWASWQKEKGLPFEHFKDVLKVLSPSTEELLEPGELTRISINDVRDIPTVRMSYNQDVPVVHASSAMRRIIALAYILVWTWEEHIQAAKLLGKPVVNQITFLIDEIESHLHPSWQRKIIKALLSVMEKLSPDVKVQLITTTHSPLIMASVEPLFDAEQDAWFDFNFEQGKENSRLKNPIVTLQKFDFEKQGDAANWLTSEAFDLKSSRSIESEQLLEKASTLLQNGNADSTSVGAIYDELLKALGPKDDFLFRWRAICQKRGLLA